MTNRGRVRGLRQYSSPTFLYPLDTRDFMCLRSSAGVARRAEAAWPPCSRASEQGGSAWRGLCGIDRRHTWSQRWECAPFGYRFLPRSVVLVAGRPRSASWLRVALHQARVNRNAMRHGRYPGRRARGLREAGKRVLVYSIYGVPAVRARRRARRERGRSAQCAHPSPPPKKTENGLPPRHPGLAGRPRRGCV